MKFKSSLVGLTASCLLACSSSDTQATAADYDDVAQALSSVVATSGGGGDMGSFSDSVTIALGTPPGGITLNASGDFVGNRLGLSYDYTVACSDMNGVAMTACSHTSDSAAVKIKWSGDLTLANLTAQVDREGTWNLTKIQSGTIGIVGQSQFEFDTSFQSLFRDLNRQYHLGYSADYSDVQVRLAPAGVIGGTIKYVIEAERKASGVRREAQANFHMDGLLAFTANGQATLTLDGTYNYAVNTISGQVTKMASTTP